MTIDTRDPVLQLRALERVLEKMQTDRDSMRAAWRASLREAEQYRMALAEIRTVLDRLLDK